MAQPSIFSSEDWTELQELLFEGKISAKFQWEVCLGQFLSLYYSRRTVTQTFFLLDPALVHDNPPPKSKTTSSLESSTEADIRTARDEAAVWKTNDANVEWRNKGTKVSPNGYFKAKSRFSYQAEIFRCLRKRRKENFLRQPEHVNFNSTNIKFSTKNSLNVRKFYYLKNAAL